MSAGCVTACKLLPWRTQVLTFCATIYQEKTQILAYQGSYFSRDRHDHDSRKWSRLRYRAARRGRLLGWPEWNGFAMVTAGKGQGERGVLGKRWPLNISSLGGLVRLAALQDLQPRRMNVEWRPRAERK